jgi:hypothetical protein
MNAQLEITIYFIQSEIPYLNSADAILLQKCFHLQ